MKIDTSRLVRNLKGEPYTYDGAELTVGVVVAEALATYDMGGKMKLFTMAQKAYKSDGMEADLVDAGLISKALEGCRAYSSIILGQAMLAVEEASKSEQQ